MHTLKLLISPFFLLLSQFGFARNEDVARKYRNQTEARFLQTVANVRLLDWNEGMVAYERSNNPAIKKYAEMMLEDQGVILMDLNKLALSKNIALPIYLGHEEEKSLNGLKIRRGIQFDQKFLDKMISDHQRDLRLFRRAINFDDIDIRTFAGKYLSLIQVHLLLAKSLRYQKNAALFTLAR